MTQDPIQPLADVGRRVLRILQHLATPPGSNHPLDSYESLLLDPVVALSDICNELLEQPGAAPAAAEHEDLREGTGSRPVSDPNASRAFPFFSRAGAVAPTTRIPGHDGVAHPRTEIPAAVHYSGASGPGLDAPAPFEQSRRAMDDPVPLPERPGTPEPREAADPSGGTPRADSWERPSVRPRRPVIDGSDRYPEARQRARRGPPSRRMPHPAERPSAGEHPDGSESESSQEEHGEQRRPVRATEPPSRVSSWAENGPARGAADATFPPNGSRLTASTERLAAMLRAHVAQTEPVTGTEPEETSFTRPGDDGRGTHPVDEPARARPDGRVSVEEIMERLADELETEFVRTYGSSGG
jgi:hypothetical protein